MQIRKNDSGSGLLEFNFFVYCGNNPVNNADPTGHGIVKKILNLFKYNFRFTMKKVNAFLKSTKVKIGAGVGVGASKSSRINGVKVTGSVIVASTDYLSFENGSAKVGNIAKAEISGSVENVISLSRMIGYEHLFSDERCSCDIMDSPIAQRYKCPASQKIDSSAGTVGLSFDAYCIFGISASVEIDIIAWDKADRSLNAEYNKFIKEWMDDL